MSEIEALPHNAWISAIWHKPPKDRKVLARFEDGHEAVAKWNGMYWVGQYDMKFSTKESIMAFLIYEKFDINNVTE